MTKNIRKAAPEGAEYFRITGDMVEYAKLDEDDRLYIYDYQLSQWELQSPMYDADAVKSAGFHAFEAPKWIWFAFGGLFGTVVVSLICGLVEVV